jgi:hypothetical protein
MMNLITNTARSYSVTSNISLTFDYDVQYSHTFQSQIIDVPSIRQNNSIIQPVAKKQTKNCTPAEEAADVKHNAVFCLFMNILFVLIRMALRRQAMYTGLLQFAKRGLYKPVLPSLHPVLLLVSTSACNSMGQTPV